MSDQSDWDRENGQIRRQPLVRWRTAELAGMLVILRLEYRDNEYVPVDQISGKVQLGIHPSDAIEIGQALLELGHANLAPAPPCSLQ